MESNHNDIRSKSFLESLLSSPISSFEITSACSEGDNMAGSVQKIHIIPNSGPDCTLILKQIPENPPDWIIQGQIFRTEHAVYRSLAPLMKTFAQNKNLNYEPPLPKYYTGFNNDQQDYLILEDLRPSGYTMQDKRISLTLEEMALVINELAQFHAVSYALIKYEGDKIFDTEDFQYLAKAPYGHEGEGPDIFDEMIQMYFEETTELMLKRNEEIGQKMKKISENAWRIRKDAAKNPEHFKTIVHFDLWINNMLIKYKEEEGVKTPTGVKFIDFQFTQIGSIFSDLQYLIFTSTTKEFRKEYLPTVLNTYFEVFTLTLDKMGCNWPLGFSRGYVIDEFYKWYVPGLIHMAFAIALQLGDLSGLLKEMEEGDPSPVENREGIKQLYLRSPIAIKRFEGLAEEVAALNLI